MASDKINSLIDVKTVEKEIASTVDSLDKILQKMTAITAQAAKSGFIKNAKDIEQLTKASEELNAITEEQIALDKEVKKQKDALAAATAKLAALQTEEAKALEEARQKTAEATRELKNRVAAERAAEGSIAKMRGELNALTAQYDKLSQEERENISVGGKMQSQIKGLSDALKQLEHQTGRDQRNVGNYAEAIDIATMSLGELKRELRALRNQPLTGATPEQLAATEARMAELTDAVGDYSARIKTAGDKTQLMIEAGQGLIAVAQFGTATMSMFGIENEKLEKSMVQLIGVAQGLATIHQLNEKQVFKSALATAKDTYAKIANTVATYANARANEASTKVMSSLWKVIAANPMTALVLGIAAVTAGLIALVNALRPAKSTLESLAESQKAVFDSAFETVGSLEAYRSIIIDTTRTERERTAAMNAYNKIAKEQGLATVSLTMSTAELNAAMDENLKRVYAQAAATAAMNEMTAKFAELIKLRAIQQKYANDDVGLRAAIQQKIDETNEEIKSLQSLYVITTSYTEGVKQGTDKVNLLVKGMAKINEETKKDTDNTTKASKARRKMNEDLNIHMESINSASDQLKKLADEEASYVAKATKRQTELTNNTIGDLKKMLQEGTITADEYESKVSELAQARLDMERYNFRELKRLRDEDMISEEQYLKARNEALMAYGDAAMGVLTAGFQFVDAQQEAELSKFKEGQDKKLESLQNALNNNIISQQAYDVQKAAIEKETEKREKIMARNKAKREKADALFSIGVSTSKAIMAIWADLTLSTIAKGIFTALVAAQGALQTAAVASKPLPAYEKGGTVRETGLALVSEKGSELIDTGAGMFITPSMPTIMPLNAGWKVTPADKTAQMLNSGEIVSKLDAVERAITNKREFGINVTEQGFYVVAKRGNSRQTYINKKFKN